MNCLANLMKLSHGQKPSYISYFPLYWFIRILIMVYCNAETTRFFFIAQLKCSVHNEIKIQKLLGYLPGKEETYPTKREKRNHRLKSVLGGDMLVPRRLNLFGHFYSRECKEFLDLFRVWCFVSESGWRYTV